MPTRSASAALPAPTTAASFFVLSSSDDGDDDDEPLFAGLVVVPDAGERVDVVASGAAVVGGGVGWAPQAAADCSCSV